jgi:hypothetical protein
LERFIPPVKIGDAKLLRFKELLQEASLGKAVSLQPIMNFAAGDAERTQAWVSVFAGDARATLAMLATP